ncbi:lipopolysaccharide biosynthesis protein [Peribacillus muralis]|uniref:lipopolysaccharide biosynthesis protein n=1 Tax=Peribacillus muralis TaxID=264697 RepID=UPI003D077E00
MREKILDITWMLYGHGGKLVFQTGYFLLLAFLLGPREYGVYVTIAALIVILGPFCGVGFNSLITKVISTDNHRFPCVFGNAIKVTIYSYFFLLVIGTMIIFIVYKNPFYAIKLFLILSFADLLLLKFSEMSAQIFIARGKVKASAHIQNFISVVRFLSVLIYYFLFTEEYISKSVINWAIIYFVSSLLFTILVFTNTLLKNEKPKLKEKITIGGIREGVYFSIGLSSQGVYNDVDKTVMGRYSNSEMTGYYGFAYKMLDVLFIPIKAILALTFPKFFKIGSLEGIQGTNKFSKKLLGPLMIYNTLSCLIAFIFVPIILKNLLNGRYEDSINLFLWLIPIVFLRNIHYVYADALTGAGFQKERSYIQIFVAVLNLILNIYFIRKYDVYGAITVSILSDAIMVILIFALVRYKLVNKTNVTPERINL